jgi:hypothetical protein
MEMAAEHLDDRRIVVDEQHAGRGGGSGGSLTPRRAFAGRPRANQSRTNPTQVLADVLRPSIRLPRRRLGPLAVGGAPVDDHVDLSAAAERLLESLRLMGVFRGQDEEEGAVEQITKEPRLAFRRSGELGALRARQVGRLGQGQEPDQGHHHLAGLCLLGVVVWS